MTDPKKPTQPGSLPSLSRVDRRLLQRVVLIGVATFAVGYLFTALLFFRGSSRPDVVTVPDLRNLDEDEARERLDDLELELTLGDSLPHPQVPAGQILAQSPLPGREVAPGSSVRVILSAGRAAGSVPDVTRMTQEPASRLLTASGFKVHVEEVPDALPRGRVIGTEPAAGAAVSLPAVVRLRVSAGPPLVEVPSLLGLGEDEARLALEGLGLRLGEVDYVLDEFGDREAVVDQSPSPGDSVRLGAAVQVRIAMSRPRER